MSEQREDLGFDPDALRAKYREERDKRVRQDANEQYIEVKGDFSHYIDDPYLDATLEREPLTDEVDVVVIGGGFGGSGAASLFILTDCYVGLPSPWSWGERPTRPAQYIPTGCVRASFTGL